MALKTSSSKLPSCLFASAGYSNSTEEVLKSFIEKDALPSAEQMWDGITCFPWSFETKYYTCTVRLCMADLPVLDDQFADSLEALILLFDPNKTESWSCVTSWLSHMEHAQPAVKLLVCQSCTDHCLISRTKVHKWCSDNEFELIELDSTLADDEEDEFDVIGVKRLTQALHAHTWSNLVMKDNPDTVSSYMKHLMTEANTQPDCEIRADTNVLSELGMEPGELANALNDDTEDGVECFEKLFSKLQLMKDKAQGLSTEDRKSYAEKIALTFYQALGGSDEED